MMIPNLSITPSASRILNLEPQATLLVDPAGADNSVLYTARERGAAGEDISVTYAAPAAQSDTGVGVAGAAITMTAGTKARMVITGTSAADGTVASGYSPPEDGRSYYDNDDSSIQVFWSVLSGKWQIASATYLAEKTDAATSPDGLTGWTIITGSGQPTVVAATTSAAQVIRAINASTPAAALVTASESGASTGPVAAVAAAFLALP